VVAAAQERDLVLQRLSAVDASYHETRVALAETEQRMQELRAQLAMMPERTITLVRSADNPDVLSALKAGLLALQVKRIELLVKYEPTHRLVQEALRAQGIRGRPRASAAPAFQLHRCSLCWIAHKSPEQRVRIWKVGLTESVLAKLLRAVTCA